METNEKFISCTLTSLNNDMFTQTTEFRLLESAFVFINVIKKSEKEKKLEFHLVAFNCFSSISDKVQRLIKKMISKYIIVGCEKEHF